MIPFAISILTLFSPKYKVLCGSKGNFLEFAASCEECSQDASVCGGGGPYGEPADCKWTNQKCIFDESKSLIFD